KQILIDWNATNSPYPREASLPQLFESQVERAPAATALVFGEQRLTYQELNERANRLAHYLRKRGVGPEMVVGICIERSVDMIVGLLGILKAGAAYLPLDPSYPAKRLSLMLTDVGVKLLLAQQHLRENLASQNVERIFLDSGREGINNESNLNSASLSHAQNLAYVTYTSGSTGQPKAV